MWQLFTERARRIVFFAQEEARGRGENYVSTEHLLLGLCRENDHVAAQALERMGVTLEAMRASIHRQVAKGNAPAQGPDMQITPRGRRVIDLAHDEARQLGQNYLGSEHLLLGLIREEEGLAGRVLAKLGVDLERTRREVVRLTEEAQQRRAEASGGGGAPPPAPESQPTTTTAAAQKGDLGVLRASPAPEGQESSPSAPAPTVPVFTLTDDLLGELAEISAARDFHGYAQLLDRLRATEGAMNRVPGETRAKLLRGTPDAPAHFVFVRIEEGQHAGTAAWTPVAFFVRTGPDTRPFPPPE